MLFTCCSDEPLGAGQDASPHISNLPRLEDAHAAVDSNAAAFTDTSDSDAVSIESSSSGSAAAAGDIATAHVPSGLVRKTSTLSPVDTADVSGRGSAASPTAPPSSPSAAPEPSQGAVVTAPLPAALGQASARGPAHDARQAAGPAARPRPQRPHVGTSPGVPGRPAPPGAQGAPHGSQTSTGPGPAHCDAEELFTAWHYGAGPPAAAPKKKR